MQSSNALGPSKTSKKVQILQDWTQNISRLILEILQLLGICQSGKMISGAHLKILFSRFWHNPEGLQISSPFLVCINLLERSSDFQEPVEVSYKISAFNRVAENYEECSEGVASVSLKSMDTRNVKCVAVENIALKDEHYNDDGDLLLQVRYDIKRFFRRIY